MVLYPWEVKSFGQRASGHGTGALTLPARPGRLVRDGEETSAALDQILRACVRAEAKADGSVADGDLAVPGCRAPGDAHPPAGLIQPPNA